MRASPPALAALLLLGLTALPLGAGAQPPSVAVPSPLEPWVPWVLQGHEAQRCPFLHDGAADGAGDGAQVQAGACAWPTALSLALEERGGRFTQSWRLFARGRVALPGDAKRWPQDVTLDGAPAVVVARAGVPTVELPEGVHTLAGSFRWDALPESLAVPQDTGLLSLSVRGKPVREPHRGEGGTLFLEQAPREEAAQREAVELRVFRRVTDEVPLRVDTRVELEVSGRNRELLLGRALLPGTAPLALESELPARLEPDGRLRVQVRPGRWAVTVTARHEGPATSLTRPAPGGPWAEGEEVWVFDARPAFRVATVEGVSAVDPAQTTLPEAWRALPAYAVPEGGVLQLKVERRGDADPAPDRLALQRELWLDFDGKGLTARDTLTGTLSRAWRLTMQEPAQLGRVSVGDEAQFITRLEGAPQAGVEVRQGKVQVSADSRVPLKGGAVSAVGWAHDFDSVRASLHLPPGWTLVHAGGVDSAETWVTRWSLLDLFLVVIIALATGRLFGPRWGVLALLALGLSYHEAGAPRLTWLAVLAAEALVRALPEGALRRALGLGRLAAVGVLVLVGLSFAVDHVRQGLYPVLARPGEAVEGTVATMLAEAPAEMEAEQEAVHFAAPAAAPQADGAAREVPSAGLLGSSDAVLENKAEIHRYKELKRQRYDKDALVQTGPGLPQWEWDALPLSYSGPVQAGQELSLWLVPPWANRLLAFLRVGLVALLALLMLGVPRERWPSLLRPQGPAAAAAALLLALLLPSLSRANEAPSAELLTELRQKLLERPDCYPACASAPRLLLEVTPKALRARMEVNAAADTGVPLPGSAGQWEPERVLLDGQPARAMLRDAAGVLFLMVPKGVHQVVLEGALPARDTVSLALPLRPFRVEAQAAGWQVDGLFEDGHAEDDLQLTRVSVAGAGDAEGASLQPAALPPFLVVERTLELGLTWQVHTQVKRLSPAGSAVMLAVPLLPGEAVTTESVRVEGGKALLNLGPQVSELEWTSSLEPRSPVVLAAPKGVAWTEVWRLSVGPTWHFEASGLPPVHTGQPQEERTPEYRPWPGEALTVALSRPVGVGGQTLTVDGSSLTVTPGVRATQAALTLSLRSSRGGQHVLTLPEGAALEKVTVNGNAQPLRQDGRKVTLPVSPGAQKVVLEWREPAGISALFRAPAVDLGQPSVNATVRIEVPHDRWVLLTFGPAWGPAVLFWGLLLVVVGVSAALGRVRLTPLGSGAWVLLGVGLTQVPVAAAAFVACWLLLLGWRGQALSLSRPLFNLRQVALVGMTLVSLLVLAAAVREGLLGRPDMQVEGNGSTGLDLRWYQDRLAGPVPAAGMLTVPLLVYRAAMLAWAMWLAFALLGWLKWGWACFTEGGLWRPEEPKAALRPAAGVPATATATPAPQDGPEAERKDAGPPPTGA
jgi:hypothetical protein